MIMWSYGLGVRGPEQVIDVSTPSPPKKQKTHDAGFDNPENELFGLVEPDEDDL